MRRRRRPPAGRSMVRTIALVAGGVAGSLVLLVVLFQIDIGPEPAAKAPEAADDDVIELIPRSHGEVVSLFLVVGADDGIVGRQNRDGEVRRQQELDTRDESSLAQDV